MSSNLKKSLENKIYTLKIIEESASKVLRSNPSGSEKSMAEALLKITKHVEENLDARIGRLWKNSNKNLSHILYTELKPLLSEISMVDETTFFDVLKIYIHPNSTSKNYEDAIKSLHSFYYLANVNDQEALDLLYGELILINGIFSPNIKRVKKSDDHPYCKFCYREARPNFDTCEDHGGIGRADGKKQLNRYLYIKKQLLKIKQSEPISDEFLLNKLNTLELLNWKTDGNAVVWITELVKKLRLHSGLPTKVTLFAQDKADFSKKIFSPYHHSWDWPVAFDGTLFRYEVSMLAKFKSPNKATLEMLDKYWNGEPILNLCKNYKIEKHILKRRSYEWKKRITGMRNQGVLDSVIKIVLGFDCLPI